MIQSAVLRKGPGLLDRLGRFAVAGLLAAGCIGGAHAQATPTDATSQIRELLRQVEDRDLRRQLTDRWRSGDLTDSGVVDALRRAHGAPAISAPLAPQKTADKVGPATVPGGRPDDPLGATYSASTGRTTFRVQAPRAFEVTLQLHEGATGPLKKSVPMARRTDGIWQVELDNVGPGTGYTYSVDGPAVPGAHFDPTKALSDPYAHAVTGHGGRSLVMNTRFDWGRTASFRPPAMKDLVVYEMHVKDWTAHPSAGVSNPKARGKFLGLAEPGDTDRLLGHLVDLGVNAVELLPVHEFDNAAAPPGHVNYWGYMTTHFFAPETAYASGANGEAVRELQQAVKAFHEKGIAVILDVVYNHTAEGNEDGPTYNFKGLDNEAYYRLTPDKKWYYNGTGCGNEIRSEHPIARRLIIDSLKYFMNVYKVDGFRLDLGAGLDRETMIAIEDQLPPHAILIAEPWTADWGRKQWDKPDLRGRKWALWNDGFRDHLKNFVMGKGSRNDVISAVAGSCFWWAGHPAQSINYLESHDGDVLEDFLKGDIPRHRLAAIALLTSQGIPMLQEGQEFRRTKKGNNNSYDQDNDTNYIDWSFKARNRELFDLYKGLIALRAAHPSLRSAQCLGDSTVTWFRPADESALGFRLHAPGQKDLLVLLNSSATSWVPFGLPGKGTWTVLCNGKSVKPDGSLGTASGDYKVPPSTGIILGEH